MRTRLEHPAAAPGRASRRHGPLSSLARYPVFESLRYRDFRWMWAGSFVSFMAMNMQMITRSWLVVRLTDDSPLFLSLSMVSFAVPVTFVSLIGGALADRVPRRRLVIMSQSGNALMTLLLAVLDVTGVVTFWHVMAMGVVNGSLMAFNMPSRQAIISEIVPERRLMNAISLNNSSMNLTRVVGPALAGFLILLVDTAGVFFIVSAIYVFSVLSMTMVHAGTEPAGRSGKGVTGDIREGLAYALGDRTLRGLIIMNFIPVLFGFSYYALLPAWAREALDVQSDDLGILMMLMGVGALTGTLILASMGSFRRRGAFLLVSLSHLGRHPSRVRPHGELSADRSPPHLHRTRKLRFHVLEHDPDTGLLRPSDARPGDEHNHDELRSDAAERRAVRTTRRVHQHPLRPDAERHHAGRLHAGLRGRLSELPPDRIGAGTLVAGPRPMP